MNKFIKCIKYCNELISILLQLIIITILIVGACFTYKQLKQNATATKYRYLTGVWNDIMKESIEHPEFNDKSKTLVYSEAFHGDQKRRYEIYVRWIGGFIEDLHANDYKEEGWLYYEPWIKSMLGTHSTWFIDHIDYYEYTDVFYKRLSDLKKSLEDTQGN